MLKYTHGFVGAKVADYLGVKGIKKLTIVVGSIVPDCVPSCFYANHTYNRWFDYFNSARYRLASMNKNIIYYFLLGKEMHLCADFFTWAHNKESFIDFCNGHCRWERTLNTAIIKKFNIVDDCDRGISELHKAYLKEDASIPVDVAYISIAVSSLIHSV